jgi:hypothetical protein
MNTNKMNTNAIKTGIELITPSQAKEHLANNHANQRNVTKSHVLHLSQQMKAGQWIMTGEAIIFDQSGNLLDGQHRLKAVIMSGVDVPFMVIRGVDPDAFKAMGRGKVRSNGNIFAIHGIQNYNIAASATAGVLNYRRAMTIPIKKDGKIVGMGGSLNSYIRPSTTDLVEEYDKHPDEYQHAVKLAQMCRASVKPSSTSTVAALSLIDGKHTFEEVQAFWDAFKTGANLSEGDPILTLRNRISENTKAKAKLSQNMITVLMIKAWNFYVKEKSCRLLRAYDGEPCPQIL